MINWVFDPVGPSGAKEGGNSAEYSVDGDLDIFVRESIQNSYDARVNRNTVVEVFFNLRDIEGEEKNLFLKKIRWQELKPHLTASAETKKMPKLEEFLDSLHEGKSIRLLSVEDRNCMGMTGEEDEDEGNFKGLLKNSLYSNKDGSNNSTGGTFGLGKSVY